MHCIPFTNYKWLLQVCSYMLYSYFISSVIIFTVSSYFSSMRYFNFNFFLTLDFKTSAKFLLVVEKDASFQHVVASNFIKSTGPCIIATVSSACCLDFVVGKANSIPLPCVTRLLCNFLVINLLIVFTSSHLYM